VPLDLSRPFLPLRVAVLVVSDTRSAATDTSGATLRGLVEEAGHRCRPLRFVADEVDQIEAALREWVADPEVDVVLSTGGTGVTHRDVTPEAVRAVLDKELPGFGELFRWFSFQTIGTSAIQSRALGGVAGRTLVFALPGSRGAVTDAWTHVLKEQLDSRHRPCNFADLLPRIGGEP
jgi:molybdenum cofactor biosynthesis protein B